MARRNIIQTAIGTLWGRDCIFLDRVSMPNTSTLILEGTINTRIVKQFVPPKEMPASEELPYVLSFNKVLAVQILELDTWESQHNDEDYAFMSSSFQELVGARWLSSLGGKVTADDRHFSVLTYDDVIDVICRDFELTFNAKAA